jgi:GT2 family glycosyltransferase
MRAPRSVSFITCVADPGEYAVARSSIERLRPAGLRVGVEAVENSGNRYSCAKALNLGRSRAPAELLVFCHEDVVFPEDWLERLLVEIARVETVGANWGVLGPMGRSGKRFFGHARGPGGEAAFYGPLPARVETLDELCLVVPGSLPLSFDETLGGYHLYGVDLCIQAAEAGHAAFAIDAPVRHDSMTRHRPPEYHRIKRRLQRKWRFRRRKVGSRIGTTCGPIRFGLFQGWV